MKTDLRELSPTTLRTRQAILATAARVLGQDPAASLGTIAQEANVGRTTLHRHFPDRATLLTALNQWVREQLDNATRRARLDEGTGLDVLVRLCSEYYELSDVLGYIFNAPEFFEDPCNVEDSAEDDRVEQAIAHGRHDGSIDPQLPSSWIVNAIWAALYAAWQYQVTEQVTRHEVLQLLTRSVRKLASA